MQSEKARKTISFNIIGHKMTSKDGTKTWISYKAVMLLVKKGEEEKGVQPFKVDVVVTDKELRGKLDKIKGRIKITAYADCVSAPSVYSINETKDEKGNIRKHYPTLFIREAIDAVSNPRPARQDAFPADEEEDF